MTETPETAFIKKYIVRQKRDRYLTFLASSKTRKKFTDSLYHFSDFKWDLLRLIESEHEVTAIKNKLKIYPDIRTCSVISTDKHFDGQTLEVSEAIDKIVSTEGTILIFGHADFVYYEGEAPNRRYISR